MRHNDCDHVGHERYVRRAVNNGGFVTASSARNASEY